MIATESGHLRLRHYQRVLVADRTFNGGCSPARTPMIISQGYWSGGIPFFVPPEEFLGKTFGEVGPHQGESASAASAMNKGEPPADDENLKPSENGCINDC